MRRQSKSRARTCRCRTQPISKSSHCRRWMILSRRQKRFPIGIEMAKKERRQPGIQPAMQWHRGGCHCGAVAFEVQAPDEVELVDCNCSMCAKTGYLHLIVPKSRFTLVRGEDVLATYTF